MISDERAFLTSLRLSDSFLPIGTYTSSYGLESFIREEIVETPDELQELLADYLQYRIGPCDMIALSAVHNRSMNEDLDRIAEIDIYYGSMQFAKESRESSLKSGQQLLDLMIDMDDNNFLQEYEIAIESGNARGHYPIILGIISRYKGVSKRDICLVHGYSFVAGLLGAAQRLLGLGHTDIQEILQDLHPIIIEVWQENQDREIDKMQSFTPFIDIMGMKHERSDVRLFIS